MKFNSTLFFLFFVAVGSSEIIPLEKRQAGTLSVSTSVFVVPTAVPAPNINSSQYDISQHYCRIYRHASTYADGKIYIDGGNTYVPRGNGSFFDTAAGAFDPGMNNNLVVLDLSKNFTNQDTFPYMSINKGPDVPSSLIEHALWYSAATRKVYQIGGWFSYNSVNDPGYWNDARIPESAIWEFDIDKQTWSFSNELNLVNTGKKVNRPGAAANCDVPALNMSFIFEGYVQQRSDHDYINFTKTSEFQYIEGMLSLDTRSSQSTLTNISVPKQQSGSNFGPRMNGAMVHVPVGKYGILVQLGGQMTANPTAYGVPIPGANAANTNIPMDFVDIYDIESGFWFRQQTFALSDGFPTERSDICTVVVPASDNSSFTIYMIAGIENYSTYITTEEIWILTLPSFQWALAHSKADGMYGHTCHAVGENLLIIGGMQTQSSNGSNVDTCATHMPAEIFSLVTQNYTGTFDAAGAHRLPPVPSKVVAAIGGSGSGGAYVTSPKIWNDNYLQYIFNPSLSRTAYTPTYTLANVTDSSSNGTQNSTVPVASGSNSATVANGAVIGGAVGGSLGGILLIAGVVMFFCRRHRKSTEQHNNRQSVTSELPAYSREVKYDSGPIFRGVPTLAVAQADGPAELHPQGSFSQSPQTLHQSMYSDGGTHSPPSTAGHKVIYLPGDDRTYASPSPEERAGSVSPSEWIQAGEHGAVSQRFESPESQGFRPM